MPARLGTNSESHTLADYESRIVVVKRGLSGSHILMRVGTGIATTSSLNSQVNLDIGEASHPTHRCQHLFLLVSLILDAMLEQYFTMSFLKSIVVG